ncbi:hypothetical protein EVA_18811 [gut metagenome]|uniref:Uncharacterized protein n=1 Tax=gut metagenome TaxID=749906 RepID=J9FU56_9ZZZZ
MKNTYFSGNVVLSNLSTPLTPGSAANRFPASPSSAARICKGSMRSIATSTRADLHCTNFCFISILSLFLLIIVWSVGLLPKMAFCHP